MPNSRELLAQIQAALSIRSTGSPGLQTAYLSLEIVAIPADLRATLVLSTLGAFHSCPGLHRGERVLRHFEISDG